MTSDRIWGVLYSKSKIMKIMNTSTTKTTNTNTPTLNQFTNPDILHTIGLVRVAKLLGAFSSDFARANIVVPAEPDYNHPPVNGEYYDAVAVALASSSLPEPLLSTLLTIERAAAPESAAALDDAIQRRLPCISLKRDCPLDCALELFFACPDELSAFDRSSSCSSSNPAPASPPIEIRKSKIENNGSGSIILDQVRQRFDHYLKLPPGA